jgi:hypothetical protein
MKTVVTHINPDQDAVCAVWLVKMFFPGWADAAVKFIPAGSTFDSGPPDEDPDVIHVDTGLGRFDHHQTGDRTLSASSLVFREIKSRGYVTNKAELEALERMVAVVRDVDHALERTWPEPTHDRYEFLFDAILNGLKKNKKQYANEKLIEFGFDACNGIFWGMKQKVLAGKILAKGDKFESRWGQGVALETLNESAMTLAQRRGYQIVVGKSQSSGNVKIYGHPGSEVDLNEVCELLVRKDSESDWYLHPSKKLLLNGSSKNPNMRPTKLSLGEVVEIIKNLSGD